MIEMQQKPSAPFQPSRERLAFLLAQLSELDPDADKYSSRSLDPEPVRKPEKVLRMEPPAGSFHAALRDCTTNATKRVDDAPKRRRAESTLRPWLGLAQKGALSGLAQAWGWLHSKYATTAAKRLRLSEVVSLGDKRFVALVNVEGREFLIGGAPSGLSLLAQLGGSTENADARQPGMSVERLSR
jgi:hypothetical protein